MPARAPSLAAAPSGRTYGPFARTPSGRTVGRNSDCGPCGDARDELLRELTHRANNLLAVIRAIAAQSLASGTLEEARHVFLERLHALSRANTLLLECDWHGVQLADVAFLELSGLSDRIDVEGPDVELTSTAVQSFTLLLHELLTNAKRYGALSNARGSVTLRWTVKPMRAGPVLQLSWREHNGPSPTVPLREGFGLKLIRRTAEQLGRARLSFDPDGFCFLLSAPLKGIAPVST